MASDVRPDERQIFGLTDTIFALSSGQPPAAVAIVRISGADSDRALEKLIGRLPEPRRATLADLTWDGELLDRGLVIRFPGPNSATGEDIVELHLHGGRAVISATLAALAQVPGLRAAMPGEFTRRAFANDRIDLAEAEGLADLLEAETESQRRNALRLAGGALGRQVERWQARLLGLSAQVEALLDFSDEDDAAFLPATFRDEVRQLAGEWRDWLRRPSAERLKEGVRIVIAGPPNAGKSSLLNALAGREAAIATAVAGTTRDALEVPIALGGVPILLTDTAGLREPTDEVEAIGIARAEERMAFADIILWLGDPGSAPAGAIRVHPKADLEPSPPEADLAVSAKTGQGLNDLIRMLIQFSATKLSLDSEVAINVRQAAHLEQACEALENIDGTKDELLVAEGLRAALNALDRITGKAGVEDVLDSLFHRFCIGK